jgi:hypothetical protein
MIRSLACPVLALASAVCAQSPIESTFVGGLVISNTAPPPAATQLFDVQVLDPLGLVIHQIDVNVNLLRGPAGTLGVWITALGGTAAGNHLNAAAWTQVGSQTITHNGGREPVVLPTPFHLAQGSYGIALHHVDLNPCTRTRRRRCRRCRRPTRRSR